MGAMTSFKAQIKQLEDSEESIDGRTLQYNGLRNNYYVRKLNEVAL